MESDDQITYKLEDHESCLLPAGEGDVKPTQSSIEIKYSGNKPSHKNESNFPVSMQSTKKSLLSRLLGKTDTSDLSVTKTPDVEKFKSQSLGKLFRIKSAPLSNRENFNNAVDNRSNPHPNLSAKNSNTTSKKSFSSLLSAFQRGNRDRANSLPWSKENTEHLPKERGGSLGKFFRYGQGKKNKDNKNAGGSTHALETIDSESEYVTLPLDDNPFRDESDEEVTNMMSTRSNPASTPRSFHDN